MSLAVKLAYCTVCLLRDPRGTKGKGMENLNQMNWIDFKLTCDIVRGDLSTEQNGELTSSSQACHSSQNRMKRMSMSEGLKNGSQDAYCVLMTKVQFMLCPRLLMTRRLRVQHRSLLACLGPTGSADEPASNSQSEILSYTIKQFWKPPCNAHTHVCLHHVLLTDIWLST